MTTKFNGKEFQITISDGEAFFQHVDGPIHTNTLKSVARQLSDLGEVKVFDPKNGVISFYGDEAVFWASIYMQCEAHLKLNILFGEAE